MFLRRAMKNKALYLKNTRAVRYQARNGNEKWSRQHIRMNCKEYECCLDMRKFGKISVSFLIACAIDLYKDDFEGEHDSTSEGKPDNYHINGYIVLKEEHNEAVCWTIYWGKPAEIHEQNPAILIFH